MTARPLEKFPFVREVELPNGDNIHSSMTGSISLVTVNRGVYHREYITNSSSELSIFWCLSTDDVSIPFPNCQCSGVWGHVMIPS